MSNFIKFIKQNIAPIKSSEIEVLNRHGRKVGKVLLGNLQTPYLGVKLYSFGVISDVHIGVQTAESDLTQALNYFANYGCVHVCCCGDVAQNGKISQLQTYKSLIHDNVHTVMGNHEWWGITTGEDDPITINDWESILQIQHNYYFNKNNDVFIMLSMSTADASFLSDNQIQWLHGLLEENRNKRCFLFEHIFPYNSECCRNPYQIYPDDGIWVYGYNRPEFEELLKHYKNVIWFHGHSHTPLEYQDGITESPANYDNYYGVHSIHVPGLARLRKKTDTGSTQDASGSQGYVIDVYNDYIGVKGIDFITGKIIPVANYCLSTTIKNIEANTFNGYK